MTISINRHTLKVLIACAGAHIEDIESGIRDGLYNAAENADLAEKKQAISEAKTLIEPQECPPGGYYIMINHEQTADHQETLTLARQRGKELCDAEPLPATWSIYDDQGMFVEAIERSDGKDLETLVKGF